MPIYEYRCENGHEFEALQAMSDDPVETCEQCGAPVERVFHPVAVHFKGSGFYNTDYKKSGQSEKSDGEGDSGSSSSSGEGKGESSSDSGSGDSGKSSEKASESKSSSPSKTASD
ncbi:MAG: FmdB family transcriptional regulator [Actinobacteria bacterium]|nr:FmdB family transcriptional regulator [Actinomycetota bacterium]